jgi:hypothetical protein
MPLTYLDQNAVIYLEKTASDPAFRAKLDAAITSGRLSIVVSPWNLIETAKTRDVDKAVRLADFIDSLRPAWLLERHNIQKLEVQEDFYRFAKLDFEGHPRLGTRSYVMGTLSGERDSPKFDIPSRELVEQWIRHPDQSAVLKPSYEENAKALDGLRQAVKDGKMTDEVRKRANQWFLKAVLPATTPKGLEIPSDLAREYVDRGDINSIPTRAIEQAISDHEWKSIGRTDPNSQIDKFHLIPALQYVDEIVSDDKFLHRLYPVAEKTGYVRAKLLHFDEFLKRL